MKVKIEKNSKKQRFIIFGDSAKLWISRDIQEQPEIILPFVGKVIATERGDLVLVHSETKEYVYVVSDKYLLTTCGIEKKPYSLENFI